MLRVVACLFGLLCAYSVSATNNQELIKNLSSRITTLPSGKGSLIKSFTHHSQSYIYDQALAIIAFSKSNEKEKAKELLKGLESLQLKDGSLYFSYYLNGESPYPKEGGDKRYAGAIAWVALAATHYQHRFKSKEFYKFNFKILSYLKSEIKPVEIGGEPIKALRFSPSNIESTFWSEKDTAALEHNLDAYAAFRHFQKLNPDVGFESQSKDLKDFILAMWDKDKNHFWSGVNISSGKINKSELYLDNQTWSLLALDETSLKEIKPKEALDLNCNKLYVSHEGIDGFMDSKPTRRPASSQFVWSEGTLGQILAMKRMKTKCHEKSSEDFLSSVQKMKKEDGGISYATKTPNPDFTTASSVAGTTWMYFAQNNFNPFHIEEIN